MGVFTKGCILLFLSCFVASSLLHAQSVGGTTSGAATYCSGSNSGFISVTGYTGTSLSWQVSANGGATWTNTGNTTPTQSYLNLPQTSCYRVIVQDGSFPPDTSTITCITVYQPSVGGVLTGGGTFCSAAGPGSLTLNGNTGAVQFWEYSTDGGATWNMVADTTTTLTYSSITQNTIYRTIVRNGPGCPPDTSSTVSFTITPSSVGGFIPGSDTVCYGTNSGTLTLSGYTGNITGWLSSADFGMTWLPIANTTTTQNYSGLTQTTLYKAIVQNNPCTADTSFSAVILVVVPAAVYAGADTTISAGQSVILHGSGHGTVAWVPGGNLNSNSIFTPTATPTATTTYIMTVTDSLGCLSSDEVIITVSTSGFHGIVSNLFSPNDDGVNDAFYVENIWDYPDNEIHVYNIYGKEVYGKKGYTNDWKGTCNGADLPDGTYYFVLQLSSTEPVIKGSVDIIRNK